jgi:hypothetical protein
VFEIWSEVIAVKELKYLAIRELVSNASSQKGLPAITIGQEFLLAVEQFFVSLCRILKVGSLHNGIDGASLLTKATENALGHINIVAGSAATAVRSGL